MGEKQIKKSEMTRSKILEAAESEFSEKGFFGARVDNIATIAGVNKRMIYEHFGSKERLYDTTLLAVYERFAKWEQLFITSELEPALAIRNVIHVGFRFLEENTNFVRMLMWENLNNGRAFDERYRDVKRPALDYIRNQVRRGKETGAFRGDADEHQIVLSILNFEFSYFSNAYTLSTVLERELNTHEEAMLRAEFVADLIIDYLTKAD